MGCRYNDGKILTKREAAVKRVKRQSKNKIE